MSTSTISHRISTVKTSKGQIKDPAWDESASRLLSDAALLAWLEREPDVLDCVPAFIDSKTASSLLLKNTKNRPINRVKMSIYARDMINGNFPTTSNAIAFDSSGILVNGQHRLQACAGCGHGFFCIVSKGHDPRSFVFEDVQIKRSLADVLYIENHDNYHLLAGALGALDRYRGQVRTASGEGHRPHVEGTRPDDRRIDALNLRAARGTNFDRLQLLDEHPGIKESVHFFGKGTSNFLIPRSWAACFDYLGKRANKEATESFLTKLTTLVGINEGEPVFYLVKALQNAAAARRQMTTDLKYLYILKALRLTLEEKEVKCLKIQARVRNPETGRNTEAEAPSIFEDLVPKHLRIK